MMVVDGGGPLLRFDPARVTMPRRGVLGLALTVTAAVALGTALALRQGWLALVDLAVLAWGARMVVATLAARHRTITFLAGAVTLPGPLEIGRGVIVRGQGG